MTRFERLFKEAKKDSDGTDKDLYVKFYNLAYKCVYGVDNPEPVNVWHIQQNELKTIHNGRSTIKYLCENALFNITTDFDSQRFKAEKE